MGFFRQVKTETFISMCCEYMTVGLVLESGTLQSKFGGSYFYIQ